MEPKQELNSWEEEFEKEFPEIDHIVNGPLYNQSVYDLKPSLKSFIRKTVALAIAQEREEWEKEEDKLCKKIGEFEKQVIIADKQARKEENERVVELLKKNLSWAECESPEEGKDSREFFYHLTGRQFRELLSAITQKTN